MQDKFLVAIAEGTHPGSMPNPAVKPSSADGTTGGTRGRVGRRQNSLHKRRGRPFGRPRRCLWDPLPCPLSSSSLHIPTHPACSPQGSVKYSSHKSDSDDGARTSGSRSRAIFRSCRLTRPFAESLPRGAVPCSCTSWSPTGGRGRNGDGPLPASRRLVRPGSCPPRWSCVGSPGSDAPGCCWSGSSASGYRKGVITQGLINTPFQGSSSGGKFPFPQLCRYGLCLGSGLFCIR